VLSPTFKQRDCLNDVKKEAARFQSLGLGGKISYLKAHALWLDSRTHAGFEIYLYQCPGFYVELWKRAGLPHIHWIEVCSDQRVAEVYLDKVDLNALATQR